MDSLLEAEVLLLNHLSTWVALGHEDVGILLVFCLSFGLLYVYLWLVDFLHFYVWAGLLVLSSVSVSVLRLVELAVWTSVFSIER